MSTASIVLREITQQMGLLRAKHGHGAIDLLLRSTWSTNEKLLAMVLFLGAPDIPKIDDLSRTTSLRLMDLALALDGLRANLPTLEADVVAGEERRRQRRISGRSGLLNRHRRAAS